MVKQISRRTTKQRLAIINMLRQTDEHPTAEMIYESVRRKLPGISLGTVYRNLQLLVDEGLVLELTSWSGASRYDGNCRLHSHFFCQSCGRVYDIPAYEARLTEEQQGGIPGRLLTQRTDFFGICDKCLSSEQIKD